MTFRRSARPDCQEIPCEYADCTLNHHRNRAAAASRGDADLQCASSAVAARDLADHGLTEMRSTQSSPAARREALASLISQSSLLPVPTARLVALVAE